MLRKLLILAAAGSAMSACATEPAASPAVRSKPLSHELTRAEFEQLLAAKLEEYPGTALRYRSSSTAEDCADNSTRAA